MKTSILKGFSFGLASGVITTLGLMVGLYSSTGSKMVVLSGIFVIAISDALSDALGVHISEEAANIHTHKEIWVATVATFLSKFCFAMLFVIPVLLFPLQTSIIISVVFGLFIISIFSYFIARNQNGSVWHAILEHLFIAVLVIVATYYVGILVTSFTS